MSRHKIHLPGTAGKTPRASAAPPDVRGLSPTAPASYRLGTPRAEPIPDDESDDWRPLSELRDDADLPAESPDATGHCVMERTALVREIDCAGFDGSSDALSSGEEQRVKTLRQLVNRPLFRRHLVGDAALLARMEALDAMAPNFAAVTRLVRDAVHVSMIGGAPLRLTPILIVGEAGIGKSRYACALATALGTWVEEVAGSTLSDALALTGHDTSWRGAGIGRVARALLASPTSAPLVVVDECEKVRDLDDRPHPLDVLLPLLEPHSAGRFQDDYLKVPMRADRVLWLFACNAVDGLSTPFLDRVVVVPVEGLGAAGRSGVLHALFGEASRAVNIPMQMPDAAALAPIRGLSLRRMRQSFEIAIARAVAADRRFVTSADLAAAVALLGRTAERRPIGFLPAADRLGG